MYIANARRGVLHTPKNTKYIANTVCTYNKFIKNIANNM